MSKTAAVATAAIMLLVCAPSNAGIIGRMWAQQQGLSDAETQWFRDQKVPGTGMSCCNEADGTYAEEELRGDEYWTQFNFQRYSYSGGGDVGTTIVESSGWMKVPPESIIKAPNRHGAPVVWWSTKYDREAQKYVPWIRCYSPGGGF
jgi:hypothetical protein